MRSCYTGYTLTIYHSRLIEKTLISSLIDEKYKISRGKTVHPGICQGLLLGGNLTILTNLMGTPYLPDFRNNILLVEDVGIEPYNIDGMLSQLDLAGIFNQVSGVIFGKFEQCKGKKAHGDQGTIDDVINEWGSKLNVPCIKDFSYGHGKQNCVLPIGGNIILDADNSNVKIMTPFLNH